MYNNAKIEKKILKEKVDQFVQQNANLSTNSLIKKAAYDKKPKSQSQNKLNSIPIPPPSQKQQNNSQISEEKQMQIEIESVKALNLNEKLLQTKLKEKQKDLQIANDKIKLQSAQIENQLKQIDSLKSLVSDQSTNSKIPYNERRYICLSYNIIKKQQYIFQMTQVIQLTRVMQYELETQLIHLRNLITESDLKEQQYNIISFCDKSLERLKYIQSQQLNEREQIFEQKKQNDKKTIMESLLKIDHCIANILNKFDQNRLQFNFIDHELMCQLDALSMNLQRYIDSSLPQMKLKPLLVVVEQQFQRLNGQFSTIFPHYNSVVDLVKTQIQNDQIYIQIDKMKNDLNTIENQPISIRSINILRSLLIHTLIAIHTFKLRPIFKNYSTIIKPLLEDTKGIIEQYENQNEQIGQQVIWELWKSSMVKVNREMKQLDQEIKDIHQEYQGYWNNKIFDQQFNFQSD